MSVYLFINMQSEFFTYRFNSIRFDCVSNECKLWSRNCNAIEFLLAVDRATSIEIVVIERWCAGGDDDDGRIRAGSIQIHSS